VNAGISALSSVEGENTCTKTPIIVHLPRVQREPGEAL